MHFRLAECIIVAVVQRGKLVMGNSKMAVAPLLGEKVPHPASLLEGPGLLDASCAQAQSSALVAHHRSKRSQMEPLGKTHSASPLGRNRANLQNLVYLLPFRCASGQAHDVRLCAAKLWLRCGLCACTKHLQWDRQVGGLCPRPSTSKLSTCVLVWLTAHVKPVEQFFKPVFNVSIR